jgi:DNA-binding transcriptional ArsR family regulator
MMAQTALPGPGQTDLWEELSVRHHWFHILRAAIIDNKIAEMGTTAWAVYCVIKAYTDLETGASYPSQSTIASHLGTSVDTVQRALKKLQEMELVEQQVRGRKSVYRLVEHVPLDQVRTDEFGGKHRRTVAHASQPYAPLEFQRFVNQLQDFAKSGNLPAGATFNIKLVVNNIQQGDNGTIFMVDTVEAGENGRTGAVDVAATDVTAKLRKQMSMLKTI